MFHCSRPGALGTHLSLFRLLARAWRQLRLMTFVLLLGGLTALTCPPVGHTQAPLPPAPTPAPN